MHLPEQLHSRHRSSRAVWVSLVLVLGVALTLNACSTTAGTSATNTGGQSALPTTTTNGNGSNGSNGGGGNPTATTGGGSHGGGGGNPTPTTGGSGGSHPTATPTPAPPAAPSSFVWTAASSNITSNWTTIDSSFTNGNAGAILIVTPYFNPNSVYDDHPIGVWYASGRWTIFHQDQVSMIPGAAFNVLVYSSTSPGTFTWVATSSSIQNNWTSISTSLISSGSAAQLLVTPVYNPHDIYDDHPIGVWWTGSNWTVFNQDKTAMPVNAAFNVVSFTGGSGGAFVQTATSGNSFGDYTVISGNSATDNQPGTVVDCTPVYNPNDVYDDHNIGVWYAAPHWTIYNQDKTAIPSGASFYCVSSLII
jgi:hypothetical protein